MKILARLGTSPWVLSSTSFVLTALLIRSEAFRFF